MYRSLFLILLSLHMIGDFYLQTDAVAQKKKTSYTAVFNHCMLYATVLLAGTAALWSMPVFITALVLAALHFVIDSAKYLFVQTHRDATDSRLYCFDQCLHLITISAAVLLLKSAAVSISFIPLPDGLRELLPENPLVPLKWICMILLIWKPANVTIKQLISKYKPNALAQDASRNNVGAFIGTLERFLITLLLCVNQYAAIGLVLTAKSVARYDQLKDKQFAEYYLLGTLLSTLQAIGAYLFLFVF